MGLRPGVCVDLTTKRPDGKYWDFRRDEDKQMLEYLQRKERPKSLIGSPPCTTCCGLLYLRHHREKTERRRKLEG
eukprot:3482080-Prorocentrum_lima.AAC.1